MAERGDIEADACPSLGSESTLTGQNVPPGLPPSFYQQSRSHLTQIHPKTEHFDVALVVSKKDEEIGYEILEKLSNLQLKDNQRPKVCLADNNIFDASNITKAEPILQMCTLVFVVLSEHVKDDEATRILREEAIGMTRLAPKEDCDERKRYCVRPLHTLSEENRRGVYRVPCGLTSIDSIDWYQHEKPWFQRKMKQLFEFFLPYRITRELKESGSTLQTACVQPMYMPQLGQPQPTWSGTTQAQVPMNSQVGCPMPNQRMAWPHGIPQNMASYGYNPPQPPFHGNMVYYDPRWMMAYWESQQGFNQQMNMPGAISNNAPPQGNVSAPQPGSPMIGVYNQMDSMNVNGSQTNPVPQTTLENPNPTGDDRQHSGSGHIDGSENGKSQQQHNQSQNQKSENVFDQSRGSMNHQVQETQQQHRPIQNTEPCGESGRFAEDGGPESFPTEDTSNAQSNTSCPSNITPPKPNSSGQAMCHEKKMNHVERQRKGQREIQSRCHSSSPATHTQVLEGSTKSQDASMQGARNIDSGNTQLDVGGQGSTKTPSIITQSQSEALTKFRSNVSDDQSIRSDHSDRHRDESQNENIAVSNHSATTFDDLVTDHIRSLINSSGQDMKGVKDGSNSSNQSQSIGNQSGTDSGIDCTEILQAATPGQSPGLDVATTHNSLPTNPQGAPLSSSRYGLDSAQPNTSTSLPASLSHKDATKKLQAVAQEGSPQSPGGGSQQISKSRTSSSASVQCDLEEDSPEESSQENDSDDISGKSISESRDGQNTSKPQILNPPQLSIEERNSAPTTFRTPPDGKEAVTKDVKSVCLQTSLSHNTKDDDACEDDDNVRVVKARGEAHRTAKCGASNLPQLEKEGFQPEITDMKGPSAPQEVVHYHYVVGMSGGSAVNSTVVGQVGGAMGNMANVPPQVLGQLPLNTVPGNMQQLPNQQSGMSGGTAPSRGNIEGTLEWNSKGNIIIQNCQNVQIGQGTIHVNRNPPDEDNLGSPDDSSIASSTSRESPPPYSLHSPQSSVRDSTNLKTVGRGDNLGTAESPSTWRQLDNVAPTQTSHSASAHSELPATYTDNPDGAAVGIRGDNSSLEMKKRLEKDAQQKQPSASRRLEINPSEEASRSRDDSRFDWSGLEGDCGPPDFQGAVQPMRGLGELDNQTTTPGLSDFSSLTMSSFPDLHDNGQDILDMFNGDAQT